MTDHHKSLVLSDLSRDSDAYLIGFFKPLTGQTGFISILRDFGAIFSTLEQRTVCG